VKIPRSFSFFLAFALLLSVCSGAGLLAFLKKRMERRYTGVPRRVLAFYYSWYGTPQKHGRWIHWRGVEPERHQIATATHYPALGAYDSHDPEIIDTHIRQAKRCGIDGFICTWWGQGTFDDRAFELILDHAAKEGFSGTVYWETAPGRGEEKVHRAVSDLFYILNKYGSHRAFLKYHGKPVVFVYGRVMGQVELRQWQPIITEVEKRYGRDFVLIADGYRKPYARIFDGIHTYNICGWVKGKKPEELRALSRTRFSEAVSLARRNGKISCLTVIPGYDDTKIRKPGLRADRMNGETYRILWEEAIRADPDWVLITSWNEWHEGSEIEPSWEFGDKYLKLTALYAGRFKSKPPHRAQRPKAAGPALLTVRALRRELGDTPIGLFPDFENDLVLLLAEAGLNIVELSWEDLLDARKFNASRLPLLIYAGGESYRQTVRKQGDIDEALRSYVKEGGFLILLPAGPFPLYYAEGGATVRGTDKLGIQILGTGARSPGGPQGWEQPPPGLELKLCVDVSLLPDLPGQAPYPKTGDRRWRPSVGPLGRPAGARYLSLVKLKDRQGNYYGDAVSCLLLPGGGAIMYAWHRTADAFGPGRTALALLRFAAGKLKTKR